MKSNLKIRKFQHTMALPSITIGYKWAYLWLYLTFSILMILVFSLFMGT